MKDVSKKASNWRSVQWPDNVYANHRYLKDSYQILKKVHDRINVSIYIYIYLISNNFI